MRKPRTLEKKEKVLTRQHVFHDRISQEGNVIDNVPDAPEVGEYVVHRVRRGFQE